MPAFILGLTCLVISSITMIPPIFKNLGKYNSISEMYWKPEYHLRFSIGFILVGLTQIFFILELRKIFEYSTASQVAALIFTLGSVCFMSLAFLEVVEEFRLHIFVIQFYIIATLISSSTFSILLIEKNQILGILSIIPIILFIIIGTLLFIRLKRVYEMTFLHIILSYPWVIIFSIVMVI